MTTKVRKLTLEEYLAYDDGTDTRYELVDRELVERPPESDRNNLISLYLLSQFLKFVPIQLIRHKDTEVVVIGNRTHMRLPDLMVLTQELVEAIALGRATINPDLHSVAMVVEVVSPDEESVFPGTDIIQSITFPMLDLTAAQILTAGQVEDK
ncbi:MAG: Uma2 family endonuclease [Nostoc sp. TH1S01]|nr:Uma2 family endonuclease [Nostoc sp. TH1S01]